MARGGSSRATALAAALVVGLSLLIGGADGFLLAPSLSSRGGGWQQQQQQQLAAATAMRPAGAAAAAAAATATALWAQSTETETEASRQAAVRERLAQEWELDCYSRPVVGEDGKKLWELMICDALGEFRAVEAMPSNMVNSRELRKLVEKVRPSVRPWVNWSIGRPAGVSVDVSVGLVCCAVSLLAHIHHTQQTGQP